MVRTNTVTRKRVPIYTHEGGPARRISPELELRRSVMACLLWENTFYEDGKDIAQRIADLVPKVDPDKVAEIAIEAREKMKLRHVPLLIVREMARHSTHKHLVRKTLARILQRADEPAEFLKMYWKDGRQPLAAQVKKGLAEAFPKFDAYQLGKYNRDAEVKLRDVLFLAHPKPTDKDQVDTWKQLVDGTLVAPDTWEVNLSAGADKKDTFERLIKQRKLGAMALLRNLRNMYQSKVDETLVKDALDHMKVDRVLPFRFITAANHAPQWEAELEKAMFKAVEGQDKLSGKTTILVDVSGSMGARLSDRSELDTMDAACGLAILAREMSDDADLWTFSNSAKRVASRHGFALKDAIINSQPHGGTYLGEAINTVNKTQYDRLIVVTDEQAHDRVGKPNGKGYIVNVGAYQRGVGYGNWTHVDGWSEAVLNYIRAYETGGF
jgi:hypothetical protein